MLRLLPLVLVGALGCWRPAAPTLAELDRGLIVVLPGIEGRAWMMEPAVRAFRDAGVDRAIEVYEWGKPLGLMNLTNEPHNRAEMRRLAERISAYAQTHPRRPIDLVGYSGGGGLAIMLAEALPEPAPSAGPQLEHVILVQPALSPDYDLTAAMRRVGGRIVSFHCPGDWFTLGWGTATFGTMDRKYVESAGKRGFDAERALPDPSQRRRLEQHAWDADAAAAGHAGMHLGAFGYEWNKRFVAPLLLEHGPDGGRSSALPDEQGDKTDAIQD